MLLGRRIARSLQENHLLLFFGDLGAGKTTLIKGIISEIAGVTEDEVASPTFQMLNIYNGKRTVCHFDLYRLQGPEEFYGLGFDEYLCGDAPCLIEWSERIASILPKEKVMIYLSSLSPSEREIKIEGLEDL